jgi:FkbM family methyltransferase
MVVFDVGAHIGELTLLLSRFVGQCGQVHAFEPCSATFEGLKTLCKLANRANVTINHMALVDYVGKVKLHVYDSEHSSWNSLAERPLRSYGIDIDSVGIEEVQAMTVDAITKKALIY